MPRSTERPGARARGVVKTTPGLPTLVVRTGREWRAWLHAHHSASAGVWLVCDKGHTGRQAVSYEELVRHALCVGWIDSLVKRLDDDQYLRKFTPRQPTSKWSDINRGRWAELKEGGLLEEAGLAAAPTANRYAARPAIPELPAYIAKALKSRPKAWRVFQGLARTHRRRFVVWIHMARRPETRDARLRESIALLEAGKKLGLK